MELTVVAIFVAVFCMSWLVTGTIRKYAITHRVLDVPNHRSSHTLPTPSGGGIAVVLAWVAGLVLLAILGHIERTFVAIMLPPTALLAVVGYLDDRFGLSPWVRLATHFLSAAWLVLASGAGVADFETMPLNDFPLVSTVIRIVALVWLINLYNFMDGIDGLAAMEALFVAASSILFCWLSGVGHNALIELLLIVAVAGFLIWNWPPAQIFLGDSGSAWIGFALGATAMTTSEAADISIWPWIILFGLFLSDASVTLMYRLVSGQAWYEAHCSHAYQILSRRWGAHGPVTLAYTAVNIFWLLPIAIGAYRLPEFAAFMSFIALAPLVIVAWWLGAGRTGDTLTVSVTGNGPDRR